MLLSSIWMALGLALAYVGAEAFIRGSVLAARRLRIPPLIVGLTIISWGTSAPELAVSMDAAISGNAGVSVGNVLGSNVFNVGVILGLSALVLPLTVHVQLVRFDIPILVVISVFSFIALHDGDVSRTEGALLLAAFLLYGATTFFYARRAPAAPQTSERSSADAVERPLRSPLADCVYIVGGLAVLVYGADLLVDGAVDFATVLGVSEAVIGLTVVAAGTSLPELVTSIVAAARKQPDVAVGNIVGSNIFNLALILGLSATVTPIAGASVGTVAAVALLGSALILVPMAWSGFVLERWEGVVLLLAYVAYVALLWPATN